MKSTFWMTAQETEDELKGRELKSNPSFGEAADRLYPGQRLSTDEQQDQAKLSALPVFGSQSAQGVLNMRINLGEIISDAAELFLSVLLDVDRLTALNSNHNGGGLYVRHLGLKSPDRFVSPGSRNSLCHSLASRCRFNRLVCRAALFAVGEAVSPEAKAVLQAMREALWPLIGLVLVTEPERTQ